MNHQEHILAEQVTIGDESRVVTIPSMPFQALPTSSEIILEYVSS